MAWRRMIVECEMGEEPEGLVEDGGEVVAVGTAKEGGVSTPVEAVVLTSVEVLVEASEVVLSEPLSESGTSGAGEGGNIRTHGKVEPDTHR